MSDDKPQRDDEREQLRHTVLGFIAAMRRLGRRPNRTVAFGFDALPQEVTGTIPGWLLDDPHPSGDCGRWLLLEDGSVWHEVVWFSQNSDSGGNVEYRWIERPLPHLLKVLHDALRDAQRGGRGFLLGDDGRYHVRDRRLAPQSVHLPERRRRSPVADRNGPDTDLAAQGERPPA